LRDARRISSTTSVSAAVRYDGGAATLDVEAQEETTITLSVTKKPAEMLVNGSPTDAWQYEEAARTLVVNIQKGRSGVRVR